MSQAPQQPRQGVRTWARVDTVDLGDAGGAAPRTHRVTLGGQSLRHGAAHFSPAEDQDRHVLRAALRQLMPSGVTLLPRIRKEAAMQRQHGPQRGLGHGGTHRRIHHAGNGQLRRDGGIGQQAIHARPQRLDESKPGHAGQRAWQRIRHHRHFDVRRGIEVPCGLGKCGSQRQQPFGTLGSVEGAGKKDVQRSRRIRWAGSGFRRHGWRNRSRAALNRTMRTTHSTAIA